MSEDRVIVSESPEDVKLKSSPRLSATVKTNTSIPRSLPNSDEKILSRYLGPSIGSCHDICKYGVKHDYEAKSRHHFFARFLAHNQMPDGECNQSNFMVVQRKKKSEPKPRATHTTDEFTDKTRFSKQMDVPPEKIIQTCNSLTDLAAGSVHESSSMKSNAALYDQANNAVLEHSAVDQDEKSSEESMDISTDERESSNFSRKLLCESVTMGLDRTTMQNDAAVEGHAPNTAAGESPEEPVGIKLMISSIIQDDVVSTNYKASNPPEGSSVEHTSAELVTASPIKDNIVSVDYQKPDGAEESSNELIDIKMKTLAESCEGPSSLKLMNPKSKSSTKHRPVSGAETASKEAFNMKLRTPVYTSPVSTMKTPSTQVGFSKEQFQVKSLSTGIKTKRELNKLNTGNEVTGVSDRRKGTKQEKGDISGGPKHVKNSYALRKTTRSVKLEPEQERPSRVKSTTASVTPIVIKEATSSPSKTIDASSEPVMPSKLKKTVKSSPPFISSTELSSRRNQEKIVKVAKPLSAPSTKRQFTRVSSMKLRKHRKLIPSFTVSNQAKAGNFGVKEKTAHATRPNLEHVDLRTLRQKLRKHILHPNRKGGHEESGTQLIRASETAIRIGVSQRSYRDVPKSEMKTKPGTISGANSEDKTETSRKFNFSRRKVVDLRSDNSAPIKLRLRQVKPVGGNQKPKETGTKGYKNRMKSDAINVALRHQNVDDKKDTQGLFNNVIKETASKLVESRKSKVRALVGAFETVFSLQETKVAPPLIAAL
ncbi:hypothetical protein GW17_00005705 [Ensete ventricosum]|nr:hypothetical protein GW17_00005705 [Ensete ventricosum]